MNSLPQNKPAQFVHRSIKHESAHKHVSGEAQYIDDIIEPNNCLHAAIYHSPVAHAHLVEIDFADVLKSDGVQGILKADDIQGTNNIGPVYLDEPLLTIDTIEYCGQAIFVVVATTMKQAQLAVKKAKIKFEELESQLDLKSGYLKEQYVSPPFQINTGDFENAIKSIPQQFTKEYYVGGQEHFYLEGQVALAIPSEDDEFLVYSSTQHPSETQHMIARVLGLLECKIEVITRRMGGGFGGKETQAAPIAAMAAALAQKYNVPIKLRLDRDDDFIYTGKRHDFYANIQVGYDNDGKIIALKADLAGNAGMSADLTDAVVNRAMFHIDNCYYIENLLVNGLRIKTNKASNTAFRGFGGPQGIFFIEQIIDDIATKLQIDPVIVRQRNYYQKQTNNFTHYKQEVKGFHLSEMTEQILQTSDYQKRKNEIAIFNQKNQILKKGIGINPVKFGISFTKKSYNQASALICIYHDGSIQLSHGGTEMGQGLFTKVAQVVAEIMQVDLQSIRPMATNTGKNPNASATAASSGTDLNGMAAADAANKLKKRFTEYLAEKFQTGEENIIFTQGHVQVGSQKLSFKEVVHQAYDDRIELRATGFYKTPGIHFDNGTAQGNPFFYFAQGIAISEVIIDSLSGEFQPLRTDILHDCGNSINEAIDQGQIEGAFAQGVGWLTCEELKWNDQGRLLTHAPSTYKIPTSFDMPKILNVEFFRKPNNVETIFRSKAVGEPPFMHGISVFLAIKHAISAFSTQGESFSFDAPATPENILLTIEHLKQNQYESNSKNC